MWVEGMPGSAAALGCERLLRNYMKERRLIVVTVVQGGKVDIGYEIVTGAAWRVVHALENLSGGNVQLGMRVRCVAEGHCLSNFFTVDEQSFAGRAGCNVSKPSATASIEAMELCCLSTAVNVTKENWDRRHLC